MQEPVKAAGVSLFAPLGKERNNASHAVISKRRISMLQKWNRVRVKRGRLSSELAIAPIGR